MRYRCDTQGCAKFGVVYSKGDYDGSGALDCSLCGQGCTHLGQLVVDSEPESGYDQGHTRVESGGDFGPYIQELQESDAIKVHLSSLYSKINLSAAFHDYQIRIIMRELVHAYLLDREING